MAPLCVSSGNKYTATAHAVLQPRRGLCARHPVGFPPGDGAGLPPGSLRRASRPCPRPAIAGRTFHRQGFPQQGARGRPLLPCTCTAAEGMARGHMPVARTPGSRDTPCHRRPAYLGSAAAFPMRLATGTPKGQRALLAMQTKQPATWTCLLAGAHRLRPFMLPGQRRSSPHAASHWRAEGAARPAGHPSYANSAAAFPMRFATGTPKGQRASQALQPMQLAALAGSWA